MPKVQSAYQELLDLKMKPGDLDSYISSFKHLCTHTGWGVDDAGTIMLFKKGLTNVPIGPLKHCPIHWLKHGSRVLSTLERQCKTAS